jgi:Lrp/AsnC family transcriptional regulator for asnA, asnC and gidA
MIKIDELDARILMLVQKDACRSSETIAKALHLSSPTVRRRINRLVKMGVLKIYAHIDTALVGLPLTAIFAFYINPNKLNSSVQELGKKMEFTWLVATSGRYNVIARGHFATAEDVYSFLKEEISTIEGIVTTETFICIHTEKAFFMNTDIVPAVLRGPKT